MAVDCVTQNSVRRVGRRAGCGRGRGRQWRGRCGGGCGWGGDSRVCGCGCGCGSVGVEVGWAHHCCCCCKPSRQQFRSSPNVRQKDIETGRSMRFKCKPVPKR
eukprot:366276-Chlamydomonas_euryale.AAC.5